MSTLLAPTPHSGTRLRRSSISSTQLQRHTPAHEHAYLLLLITRLSYYPQLLPRPARSRFQLLEVRCPPSLYWYSHTATTSLVHVSSFLHLQLSTQLSRPSHSHHTAHHPYLLMNMPIFYFQ